MKYMNGSNLYPDKIYGHFFLQVYKETKFINQPLKLRYGERGFDLAASLRSDWF